VNQVFTFNLIQFNLIRFSVRKNLPSTSKIWARLIRHHRLGHHLYADDTQLIDNVTIVDVDTSINCLQLCIEDITRWCASRRLQLNPVKTELIWFDTTSSLKKIKDVSLVLNVGNDVIRPVSIVRYLDQAMKQHINAITSSCFFQLHRLKQVRRILGPEITASLVSAFIKSRLDYCNALLAGLPKSTIAPLHRVENATARLITGTEYHDHITPAIQSSVSSLASGVIQNYLQTECVHAPCWYWMQSNVSHWIGHCNIRVAISSLGKQSTIWSATNNTEVWRTNVVIRWSSCQLTGTLLLLIYIIYETKSI